MTIDDIKDINKLRAMLKESQNEVKYLKECCEQAGVELAKNSYAYDYKEKNLVVQAIGLNEKFFKGKCELTDLKERYEKLKKSNSNYATAVLRRNFKLDRIKNIAKKLLPLTNEYDNCYYKDKCLDCDKGCQYRAVEAILQIIEGEF